MLAERVTQWTERWWQQGHSEGRQMGLSEGEHKGLLEGKQEGLLEGERKGLLEGERKGLLEGKLQVARQMHADGVDIRSIARFTTLDIEQIKQHIAKSDSS